MIRLFILLILAVFCLTLNPGCQTNPREVIFQKDYEAPPVVQPTPAQNPVYSNNDGSLFQPANSNWSLWSDDTARQVGDIVTVQVLVTQSAENSASTGLSRDSKIDAGITSLLGYETALPGIGSTDPLNNTTAQQLVAAQSSNSFEGEGDTKRSGRVVANVSALVTQVYPNGNLLIHGSQSLLINNETSLLTVDGVIRPNDISYENVISSERIAQARVELTGQGVLSDKQRPGWLMRAFDWFWPL